MILELERTQALYQLVLRRGIRFSLSMRVSIYFVTAFACLNVGTAAERVPFEATKLLGAPGEYTFETSGRKITVARSDPWTRLSVDGTTVWSLPAPQIIKDIAVSKSQNLIAVLVYSEGQETQSGSRTITGLYYEFLYLLKKSDSGWQHVGPQLKGDDLNATKPWVSEMLSTSADDQLIFLRMGRRVGEKPNRRAQYDEQCWDIERQEFIPVQK